MIQAQVDNQAALTRIRMIGLAFAGGLTAVAYWWRTHPSPCPYGQRFWVEAPHPLITRGRLLRALGPKPGETLLEVGPGTGYYTLPVAHELEPGGALHIVDVQQEMLDHTLSRAQAEELTNIAPICADATRLPYGEARFDGAFLVTTLGEIPDQQAALDELHRVVKRGGRLVVGELAGDPHMVTDRALRAHASATGWEWERRIGPRLGFFAVLRAR